jgi:DNA-binding NtrC family response regulator
MSRIGNHVIVPAPAAPAGPESGLLAEETETPGFAMVGSGAAMARLRLQVRRIGPHFRTVLVSGEAGSGKELAARALHAMSPGAAGPFVVCPAATLGEGGAGGAGGFGTGESGVGNWGAANSRAGNSRSGELGEHVVELMAQAHRGTLFLDEIGEMPLAAQTSLLRVLRRHEWAQEGLAGPAKIDMRIVASTSQDLKVLMTAGRFRQELYHRMATLDISVPPLRERVEDVAELAIGFLRRFARMYGKSVDRIDEDAMELLRAYRWPGNVRELENLLRNAVVLSEGDALKAGDLTEFAENDLNVSTNAGVGGMARLQDVVEHHVFHVLKSCGGNKLRAAELLGICRSTLYRMLEACAQGDALR